MTPGYTLYHGDCVAVMNQMPAGSVDAIVCDPPYDLTAGKGGTGGFMGKAWDATGVAFDPATWRAALRVLKPGAFLMAFGGTRTSHRLTSAIEDAGFDIRDSIAWIHSQGWPKSPTQLKPAIEPITLARKPFRGSQAANVLEHGTGGLEIDACRISHNEPQGRPSDGLHGKSAGIMGMTVQRHRETTAASTAGRWPANVIFDETEALALDEQSGITRSGVGGTSRGKSTFGLMNDDGWQPKPTVAQGYADEGGASRYFYVAKASAKERPIVNGVAHNTVKPLTLCRYLVRLVTPPGGTVLDCFAGSGTTLQAARLEGFTSIGIESEADYLPLITKRMAS